MINEVREMINETIQEIKYLTEQINKDYASKDIVLYDYPKGQCCFFG